MQWQLEHACLFRFPDFDNCKQQLLAQTAQQSESKTILQLFPYIFIENRHEKGLEN